MPQKITAATVLKREEIFEDIFEVGPLSWDDSVPNLGCTLVHQVDGRKIQVLDVPVEEGSVGSDEHEWGVKTLDLFSDQCGEQRLQFVEVPLT